MSDNDLRVECPHCGESFHLTQALIAPMLEAEKEKMRTDAKRHLALERAEIEAKVEATIEAKYAEEREAAAKEATVRDEQVAAAKRAEKDALKAKADAEQAMQDVDLRVRREVEAQRAEISRKAMEQANVDQSIKVNALEADLAAKDVKLQQAQNAELEARRLKTEAEEAKRETELQVARQLELERSKVREAALKERDEEHRLKAAEKDKQLDDMRQQIEELRRKGSAGSQQLAGEVLELDLLVILRQRFPGDQFERVNKGQSGADVVQRVKSPGGADCGTILWETKRTKNWQETWLPKLRNDAAAIKADIAALATETMPAGVTTFAECDKVWVTSLPAVLPMAAALRHALVEVARTRHASSIKDSTKDKVLTYLATPRFRQCMSLAVEGYTELREDLDKERRTTKAQWAKREKHMEKVLDGIGGLYGDLQGIVGRTLPVVEGLDLMAIDHEPDTPCLAVVGSDTNPGLSHDNFDDLI